MPTASLIKLPIMVESYRQAEEKKVDLSDMVTLKQSDKVPGSGILTDHFSPRRSSPSRDAVHLMIVYSDNTATNLVLDKIEDRVDRRDHGEARLPEHQGPTRRSSAATPPVFPERSKKFGLGSTTAAEMIRLCRVAP